MMQSTLIHYSKRHTQTSEGLYGSVLRVAPPVNYDISTTI
jgi:hypothetical protein